MENKTLGDNTSFQFTKRYFRNQITQPKEIDHKKKRWWRSNVCAVDFGQTS